MQSSDTTSELCDRAERAPLCDEHAPNERASTDGPQHDGNGTALDSSSDENASTRSHIPSRVDAVVAGAVGAIVTGVCSIGAFDLLHAWQHSPLDRLGWLALLVWASPLIHFAARQDPRLRLDGSRTLIFLTALILGLLGSFASVNVAQHLAVAIALTGWVGLRGATIMWLVSSLAWMPAFGWGLSKLAPTEWILLGRVLLSGLGATMLLGVGPAGASTKWTLPLPPARTLASVAAFLAAIAVVGSLCWQLLPLSGAEDRLMALPIEGRAGERAFASQGVSLRPPESLSLGSALAIRRLYTFEDDQRVMATVIDATHNRHAVHDPLYCFTGSGWTMVNDRNVALPSGQARHVSFEKHGRRAELLFWFSDGAERHASIPRYWWQTMLRRLTCGRSGDEPVLVMLQSYDQRPVDWRTILDKDSPFLAL